MIVVDYNAFTIASHGTVIAILLLLIWRLAVLPEGAMGREVMRRGLFTAAALAAPALLVERVYYFAARDLVSSGQDLWE